MSIEFEEHVPQQHRERLEQLYESYLRKRMIRLYSQDLQDLLYRWVAAGNNPFTSNRYGFFRPESKKYLDFLTGERQALRMITVMAGLSEPADCGFDKYGDPHPGRSGHSLSMDSGSRIAQAAESILPYLEQSLGPRQSGS